MATTAILVIALGIWAYHHWDDPDREIKFFGFLVAWFPLAITIFVAFIPDLEKWGRGAMVTWRVGAVVLGFIWSGALWRYEALTVSSARQDQAKLLDAANEHTDKSLSKANEHTDNQITTVRDDLKGAQQHSDEQIGTLRTDVKVIGDTVSRSTVTLGESISKVGKPDPPDLARLQFSLFGDAFPTFETFIRADDNQVFNIDFMVKNVSGVTARNGDLWVYICDTCTFAKEPDGFDKPKGLIETGRHKAFDHLNPGTGLEKMTVNIKLGKAFGKFVVGFNYSCDGCGELGPVQLATMMVLPPLPGHKPTP
jgi:hypothetical protein